jgi:hypothetical protein
MSCLPHKGENHIVLKMHPIKLFSHTKSQRRKIVGNKQADFFNEDVVGMYVNFRFWYFLVSYFRNTIIIMLLIIDGAFLNLPWKRCIFAAGSMVFG